MPLKLFLMMNLTLFLLFGFLFGLLAVVGYYFEISSYVIVILAILLVFFQWLIGPNIIWWTTNMRLLKRNEFPWLWKTVEELCKKNKVPIPKLALVRSGAPNAFVFGRTPASAVLAVTQGLLNTLNEEEVKAVIAHEIGHIKHKDMIVMTIVAAIPVIAYFVARFLIYAPKSEEKRSGGVILIGLLAFAIYFITNLLVLALSRLREFYADRFSGINTKPSLLASALAKITYGLNTSPERGENAAVRSFYIADPISAANEISQFKEEYSDFDLTNEEIKKAMEWEKRNPFVRIGELFRTHPLTFKRILALKKLEKEIKV
jgi:heat shock protein HtpX